VAINLASHVEAAALIIQSGFSSMASIVQHELPFVPIRLLLKNKFESDITIGRVNMPVLVIHSTEYDRFHPFPHGQRLYDLAPFPKQLLRIRGRYPQDLTSAAVNPNFFSEITNISQCAYSISSSPAASFHRTCDRSHDRFKWN